MNSESGSLGGKIKIKGAIDWEYWIPWIILVVIIIITLPFNKIKEYFTPEPQKVVEYIKVPVPQYIYVPQPTTQQNQTQQQSPQEQQIQELKEPIVCVFSMENSIIASNDPRRCIEMCSDTGCRISLITSSNKEDPNEWPLEELGINSNNFDPSDYFSNQSSAGLSFEEVAEGRVDILGKLKLKYGINDPKRIILVDDNSFNIEKAEENGYSVLVTGKKDPGIQEEDIRNLYDIIKKF